MLKKLLSISFFAFVFGVFLFGASSSVFAFSGGNGTSGNPYIITTCSELQDMSSDLTASYKLGNDIDCSATSSWNSGAGFAPIGNSSSKFTGTLDGNNYTISHLFIGSTTTASYVGLFGYVDGGTIENVSLTSVDISDNSTGNAYAGGVVGYGNNIDIDKVSTTGSVTITGTSGFGYVGGIIGYANGGSISDSYSTSSASDYSSSGSVHESGGLVGWNNGVTIQNTYASGAVTSTREKAGGLVGDNVGTVKNSFASGTVSGGNDQGGLVGYNSSGGLGIVTNSYSVNSTVIGQNAGTVNGGSTGGVSLSSFYKTDPLYAVYTGTPAWDFDSTWIFNNSSSLPVLRLNTSQQSSNSSDTSSSNSSSGSVSAPSCGDSAPTSAPNLFQIDTSNNKAILYFSPASGTVNNYMISYGLTSGDNRFGVQFSQNQQSGVVAYAINDLTPNTTYYFRVRAGSGCMPGNWGNELKITTAKSSTGAISYYEGFVQKLLSYLPAGY